ncbi:MAG TPA: hypothetical protein VKX41_12330 [Alloacidobacterium sp.]|jgi:hypothetical protein|nr:hypothetical protein [Alloacidobacterium sp.]
MNFQHAVTWLAASPESFWLGAAALWIFSAAVSAMDPPKTGDSGFYGWLYRFTHLLAANLDRALGPASPVISPEQLRTNNKERE